MPIPVSGKIVKGFVSAEGVLDAANVEVDGSTKIGLLNGVTNSEDSFARVDGTGVGAEIFPFTGAYSATAANISEWFGGKQLVRMRCTGRGGSSPGTLRFDLPGTAALNTAFDELAALGIDQRLEFIIEYTGLQDSFLSITPRSAPSPQIIGTTNIIVRSGVAAEIEITRTSGTISDYVWTNIRQVAAPGTGVFDSLKFIDPSTQVWDASANGTLPTVGVVKGNAYRIINAPADGSGRFGEVMYTDDWVFWFGETFTAWATEPHQWGVISAHDVRRITALENDFLTNAEESPRSDRNGVMRGANYADSVAEIRLKIYATPGDYTPTDLNTTGDIDEYTDPADQTGRLAIRLPGTQSSIASVLPTLYVYAETSGGTFRRVFNLVDDFTYRGDYGQEGDYLSNDNINYAAGDTLRIYVGAVVERYRLNNFDVEEESLSAEVQAKLNRTDGNGTVNEQRLSAVESKVSALYPLTPDVNKLVEFSDIYDDEATQQAVVITNGYSLIADYRSDGDRYESANVTYDNTGTNVVTYSGLTANVHRVFGFKATAPANQVMMWLVDGATRIPFIDITAAGNIRINNYTEATTENTPVANEIHFLPPPSGDAQISTATDSLQTFTITPYPTGSTNTSRRLQVNIDIYLNGTNTQAGHLQEITLPATNIAQVPTSIDVSVPLGPLYQYRRVPLTFSYELRVSGNNYLVDFRLVSAPSDITVDMTDVAAILNYTPAATTTRTDNFQVFTDALGTYTFAGEIDFIIGFQLQNISHTLNAVAGTITSTGTVTLLNDINVPIPAHSFDSVEIPDTIQFVTFEADHFLIHNEIGALLPRRGTKWAYGLALLQNVTDRQITEVVDFTQGLESEGNAVPSVMTGTAVPGVTPTKVGQFFIDTVNKHAYISIATASSGDWVRIDNV